MAIRNRAALGVERLECRDTPSATPVGFLGGGHAAVVLQTATVGSGDNQMDVTQLGTPARVFQPVDPCLPGLFRAVQGGGGSVDA
ncbi:MAG: hypothetical protein U0871_06965 [Gemmataceae bacterium]